MSELVERLNKHADVWAKIGTTHAAFADARLVSELREAAAALSRYERDLEEAHGDMGHLRAHLIAAEKERDGRPAIEEWSAEIDRVRAHWQEKLSRAEAQRDALAKAAEPFCTGVNLIRIEDDSGNVHFRVCVEEAELDGLIRALAAAADIQDDKG